MSLVAHLVRADLRRSWLPLAAWLVLAIVAAIMPCIVPLLAGGDTRLLYSLELPVGLVTVAYPLVLLVLVVQVVQTHPLVGSTAFWMTRPIPPRTLLASKIVFLGIAAVLMPMVIEIVRMIAHGVPWSTQLGVAAGTGLAHAFLLALLMLGAAITATMSRFLLLMGAVLVSLAVFIAVLVMIGSRSASPPTFAGWSRIADPTPGVVQSVLFILGVGGALLTQYLLRSRVRTVIVAAVGIAASIMASLFWPVALLRPTEVTPSWAQSEAGLLVNVEDRNAIASFSFANFDRERWFGVRAPLTIEQLDPQFSVRIGIAEASLRIDGETVTSLRELSPMTIAGPGEPLRSEGSVPRAVLGVERAAVWVGSQDEIPVLFLAEADTVRRHAPGSGYYRGRARAVLQRHEVESVLPLAAGQVHHRGAHRVVIDYVNPQPGSLSLQIHESRAVSAFDRALHPRYSYYLRNTRMREAVPGLPAPLAAATNALRFLSISLATEDNPDGFVARELLMHFVVPQGAGGQSIVLDDAWLADAELVIVSTVRAGMVERDLEIANFPLALPTRAGF